MSSLPSPPLPSFRPRIAGRWHPPAGHLPLGAVVVLPGRGEHGELRDHLCLRLARHGYEVVTVDALPTTTLDELADLVVELGPVVLLGSDAGADEAVRIAVRAGDLVTALVVSGTTYDSSSIRHIGFEGRVLVLRHGDGPAAEVLQFLDGVRPAATVPALAPAQP